VLVIADTVLATSTFFAGAVCFAGVGVGFEATFATVFATTFATTLAGTFATVLVGVEITFAAGFAELLKLLTTFFFEQ
jgi:hypothetical protein